MTTLSTRPPRKNSAPRLDRLSITRVKCGSRPHQLRTRWRAAAVQRVWLVTTWTASPACTWDTASSSEHTLSAALVPVAPDGAGPSVGEPAMPGKLADGDHG